MTGYKLTASVLERRIPFQPMCVVSEISAECFDLGVCHVNASSVLFGATFSDGCDHSLPSESPREERFLGMVEKFQF